VTFTSYSDPSLTPTPVVYKGGPWDGQTKDTPLLFPENEYPGQVAVWTGASYRIVGALPMGRDITIEIDITEPLPTNTK